MASIGRQSVKIPAKVYAGMFPGEVQVTIEVGKRQIHLNVSEDFVETHSDPSSEGVDGLLKVEIVEREENRYVVALPGEVQGATSRVTLPREALQVA